MFLKVKEMEVREIRFDESFEPGRIDFAGEALEQATPLKVIGSAEMLDGTEGELRVQGTYQVEMTSQCDRCLGRASFPLNASFDLYYRPVSELPTEDEVEIEELEAEVGFYEGSGLELDDILREQVLLALPMQRVCHQDCQGICPQCGANRNECTCSCSADSHDDRWSALRQPEQ